MPKKVFDCNHAVCDICIKTFGQKLKLKRYTFILPSYLLCGINNVIFTFYFIPPTAGICVLYINRGGIYGIILFTFFNYIERQFQQLRYPLRDHFNYVCGISTGKETFGL